MKSIFRTFRDLKKISNVTDAEERYVALQLMKSLPADDYAVLSNVLIPYSGNVGTSQIDHIVVSVYGIFCIETKSHKGWIFGSKVRKLFTQVLYKNRYRIQPNPVEQNKTHIKALREILGKKVKVPIVNIVAFPSADKFFIDGYENVGSLNDLINTIAQYSDKVYRYSEAKEIIESICTYNMKHSSAHAYHAHAISVAYVHSL